MVPGTIFGIAPFLIVNMITITIPCE